MNTTDIKALAEEALRDDEKATKGPWWRGHDNRVIAPTTWPSGTFPSSITDTAFLYVSNDECAWPEESTEAALQWIIAARAREPQLARAVLKMLPFVFHKEDCHWHDNGVVCSCGLEAALKEIQ